MINAIDLGATKHQLLFKVEFMFNYVDYVEYR